MMMISNKNMFVSFLFSSTILVGLGPNLGITSTTSSLSSYVVNADFTCKTELDFHTWENEKEQRHIPGKQTFEQIATILMETFNEAYSDSNGPRMSSDTFASYQLEHDDDPFNADVDIDIDADVAVLMTTGRHRHRGLRSSSTLAIATDEVDGDGLGPELRTTGTSLSRYQPRWAPKRCPPRSQRCRQAQVMKMLSRYHMKPTYESGRCDFFCRDDDDSAEMESEAIINLPLLLSDESTITSLNSPALKKWEDLACQKVKDEIDDYSYGSIEDCSIILTNCEDVVDDHEDLEDAADVGGVTYVVTDNRDVVEDSDILYSFTMLD